MRIYLFCIHLDTILSPEGSLEALSFCCSLFVHIIVVRIEVYRIKALYKMWKISVSTMLSRDSTVKKTLKFCLSRNSNLKVLKFYFDNFRYRKLKARLKRGYQLVMHSDKDGNFS